MSSNPYVRESTCDATNSHKMELSMPVNTLIFDLMMSCTKWITCRSICYALQSNRNYHACIFTILATLLMNTWLDTMYISVGPRLCAKNNIETMHNTKQFCQQYQGNFSWELPWYVAIIIWNVLLYNMCSCAETLKAQMTGSYHMYFIAILTQMRRKF